MLWTILFFRMGIPPILLPWVVKIWTQLTSWWLMHRSLLNAILEAQYEFTTCRYCVLLLKHLFQFLQLHTTCIAMTRILNNMHKICRVELMWLKWTSLMSHQKHLHQQGPHHRWTVLVLTTLQCRTEARKVKVHNRGRATPNSPSMHKRIWRDHLFEMKEMELNLGT